MTKPTGRPRGRPRKNPITKTDGAYQNVFMGVGNRRDRSSATKPALPHYLSQGELEDLYQADGFAKRVIDLMADEMVRAGIEIEGLDDPSDVYARLESLDALPMFADATRWADLYGGSIIVMVVNDGGTLDQPLNENRIKDVEALRVYDRHQVYKKTKYDDPADKRYGKVKIWQVSPVDGGAPYDVHESRILPFDGVNVPDRVRVRNDGWGNSKLQQGYNELVRMGMGYQWANALLERAQQAVHGIPNLSEILSQPGGEELIRKRIDLVDLVRAINNAIAIDTGAGGDSPGETYELKSTSFTGVVDIVDRFEKAVSGAFGVPESLLFERHAGGLNNGDKVGLEYWYGSVSQRQENDHKDKLDRLVSLILMSLGKPSDDYLIKFNPLYVPDEKDVAETEYKKAQTAEIYFNIGALDPTEVREDLRQCGKYPMDDTDIDRGEPEEEEEEDGA